jgi:hypothetical protein
MVTNKLTVGEWLVVIFLVILPSMALVADILIVKFLMPILTGG